MCVKRCIGGVGWERVSEVKVQYGDGVRVSGVYRCVVTRDYIYVSWEGQVSGEKCDTVSKHDMSGLQVDRYGSYGKRRDSDAGLLWGPCISGVDGAERMLVCDRDNHRVQVCSDEGDWQVVGGFRGVEGHPLTATVSNNTVWVGGWGPNYLHKYVVS